MKPHPFLALHKKSVICALALILVPNVVVPALGQTPEIPTGISTVVPTEEGQRGPMGPPASVFQTVFLPIVRPGFGGVEMIEVRRVELGLPPEVSSAFLGDEAWRYFKDVLMPIPNPTEVLAASPSFDTVVQAFWQNSRSDLASDGATSVVGAFSYAEDGTLAGTMKVRLLAFDQDAAQLFDVTVDDNLGTFPGDPLFSRTGLAVGNQGRSTMAYTELVNVGGGSVPQILARRVDVGGTILDATPIVVNSAAIDPSAALLDPSGDRVVIVSTDFANIKGNVLDTSGPTPAVGAQFQISTTPGQFLFLPSVASNPETGEFLVVWEYLTGIAGNPQNIRGRRFDASGNPLGLDFQINTFDTNAQGQPAVAFGPNGESVVVWAGDAVNPGVDFLDVFFQAYDANGDPIGGEQRANSFTADFQDRPVVKFLPGLDAQGNPQFAIYWRDVENADGSGPRGTGTSYALFTIAGPVVPEIFADGFESGDTTAWSVTSP